MHLTEGRNTGFQKILNALEYNGSPKPLFETDEERTFFATTFYTHPDVGDGINEGINDGVNEGINDLTQIEAQICAMIKYNPTLSASTLAENTGKSKATVERAISGLKKKGYIIREGSNKTVTGSFSNSIK